MSTSSQRLVVAIGCAALASVSTVLATVGLAEWEVRTPGGHLISHTDQFKERHGDCLRSEDPQQGEPRVWVSQLSRWRYYEGLVVGESQRGFFLFDERSETLSTFDDEPALRRALDGRDPGPPISPWLTGVDGWREAWFPFVVWDPCREALARGTPTPVGLTVEQCRDALAPESLELLKRTTWGHGCRSLDPSRSAEPDSRVERFLAFCEALLASR